MLIVKTVKLLFTQRIVEKINFFFIFYKYLRNDCGFCQFTEYYLSYKYFPDINECENNNGGCSSVCVNVPGSHVCSCKYV